MQIRAPIAKVRLSSATILCISSIVQHWLSFATWHLYSLSEAVDKSSCTMWWTIMYTLHHVTSLITMSPGCFPHHSPLLHRQTATHIKFTVHIYFIRLSSATWASMSTLTAVISYLSPKMTILFGIKLIRIGGVFIWIVRDTLAIKPFLLLSHTINLEVSGSLLEQ